MRRADDHHVARHHRRRVQPDFAGLEIDLLIVVQLQIDDAVAAEARHRIAGLRVERDQPIAGRDVENPRFPTVGPVRQTAAGELARERCRRARLRPRCASTAPRRSPRSAPPRPGAYRRSCTGRRSTISGVDWRLVSGRGPKLSVLNRQATCSLLKFAGVDLIERRIVRVPEIAAVGWPLAVFGSGLRRCNAGNAQNSYEESRSAKHGPNLTSFDAYRRGKKLSCLRV